MHARQLVQKAFLCVVPLLVLKAFCGHFITAMCYAAYFLVFCRRPTIYCLNTARNQRLLANISTARSIFFPFIFATSGIVQTYFDRIRWRMDDPDECLLLRTQDSGVFMLDVYFPGRRMRRRTILGGMIQMYICRKAKKILHMINGKKRVVSKLIKKRSVSKPDICKSNRSSGGLLKQENNNLDGCFDITSITSPTAGNDKNGNQEDTKNQNTKHIKDLHRAKSPTLYSIDAKKLESIKTGQSRFSGTQKLDAFQTHNSKFDRIIDSYTTEISLSAINKARKLHTIKTKKPGLKNFHSLNRIKNKNTTHTVKTQTLNFPISCENQNVHNINSDNFLFEKVISSDKSPTKSELNFDSEKHLTILKNKLRLGESFDSTVTDESGSEKSKSTNNPVSMQTPMESDYKNSCFESKNLIDSAILSDDAMLKEQIFYNDTFSSNRKYSLDYHINSDDADPFYKTVSKKLIKSNRIGLNKLRNFIHPNVRTEESRPIAENMQVAKPLPRTQYAVSEKVSHDNNKILEKTECRDFLSTKNQYYITEQSDFVDSHISEAINSFKSCVKKSHYSKSVNSLPSQSDSLTSFETRFQKQEKIVNHVAHHNFESPQKTLSRNLTSRPINIRSIHDPKKPSRQHQKIELIELGIPHLTMSNERSKPTKSLSQSQRITDTFHPTSKIESKIIESHIDKKNMRNTTNETYSETTCDSTYSNAFNVDSSNINDFFHDNLKIDSIFHPSSTFTFPNRDPKSYEANIKIENIHSDIVRIYKNSASKDTKSTDNILLIHGFNSSSSSNYIKNLALHLKDHGFRVFAFNSRGTKVKLQTPIFYHIGFTDDIKHTLDYILNNYTGNVSLVGFSLGGNWVCKFLGEQRFLRNQTYRQRVTSAMAVSVPFDFKKINKFFMKWQYRISIQRVMANNYKRFLLRNAAVLKSANIDLHDLENCKTIEQIDRCTTMRIFNIPDLKKHYQENSCGQYLAHIKTPLLIINSTDDPVIPEHTIPFDICQSNENIILMCTKYGGHLGFVNYDMEKNFIEEVAIDFFNYMHNRKNRKKMKKI